MRSGSGARSLGDLWATARGGLLADANGVHMASRQRFTTLPPASGPAGVGTRRGCATENTGIIVEIIK